MKLKVDTPFWTQFARRYWEKEATSFKSIHTSLAALDADRIFQLLVSYSDRCRKIRATPGLKLYVSGQIQFEDETLAALPRRSDKSLVGYHTRMSRQYDDYCLVCDELLQVSKDELAPLIDFTRGLYKQVGFPNRFAELGLYLGNYRKTPFGVHVDGCGVFSFPVVGKKKFRIWTSEFVQQNPDLVEAFEYSEYKKQSKLLSAEPGDMTYWPSSAWHIAESDGSFSATWSLGVWVDRSHQDLLSASLRELLAERMPHESLQGTVKFDDLGRSDGEVRALPAIYRKSLQALQSLTPSDFQNLLIRTWVKQISNQSLKPLPQADFKMDSKTRLQLRNPALPIVWRPCASGVDLICGFGNALVQIPDSLATRKFLKDLNTGRNPTAPANLIKPLKTLAKSGAFTTSRKTKS